MNTLLRNVFANWLGLAVNMGIAFLMSPFLVHSLGDTMYGLWVLLLAVTGYMGLLDAGLKVSVVKYVSRFNAVADVVGISRVVSTVVMLHMGVSVLIMAIAFSLPPLLPHVFSIPPDALPVAQKVLLITALTLVVTLISSTFNGILAGMQRYDYANLIGVGVVLVRSAVIVFVISEGLGIVALGLVQAVAQLVSGLLTVYVAYRVVPGLQVRWSLVDRDTVKTLYSYGAFILMNSLGMFLLFNSAELIIGAFLGAAAVTYYAIAGSLLHYLAQLIAVMTQVLHPYASAQDAKGDATGLQRTVIFGTKACLMVALPATVTFMLVGETFIRFWMGPRYAEAAAPLIVVLSIGRLFWLSQSSTGNVLLGAGRHKVLTITNVLTGVVGLGLGALLVQRLGLLGLAIGMTVPLVVSQGFVLPRIAVRAFSIPVGTMIKEGYLQPVLSTIPYALVLAVLMALIRPGSLPALALTIGAAVPVLVASLFFICLTRAQRQAIWLGVTRWRPAHAPQSL